MSSNVNTLQPRPTSLMTMVPPLAGTSSNFTYRANARTPPKVWKPSLSEGRPPASKPVLTEENTPDSPAARTLSSPVPSVLSEKADTDKSERVSESQCSHVATASAHTPENEQQHIINCVPPSKISLWCPTTYPRSLKPVEHRFCMASVKCNVTGRTLNRRLNGGLES